MATDARFVCQGISTTRKNESIDSGRLGRPTLGLQPLDHHAKMAIMQLIEDRHGKTSTVITSQLPINKWYDYLDEPTLADAILDRILQHANRIELKGQSMRVRKNMQQNQV